MMPDLPSESFVLITGSANPDLAAQIAAELGTTLGQCDVQRFPDGEVSVELLESVRGKQVFLIQPTSPPVNDHLVELLALADACRRASANRITAIVPYLGYSRADRRTDRRQPITASMVAQLIETVGINHLVTLDMHTAQVEGFYHIPVDNLTATPLLCEVLRERLSDNLVVVSPDVGRVKMATEYAHWLDAPVVVLHKQRLDGKETEIIHVVGLVKDRTCLIVDDMIVTGGTLISSVRALLDAGTQPKVMVAAVHGLLLDDAYNNLIQAGITDMVITDTVPVNHEHRPMLTIVSIAPLIATAIRRFLAGTSLTALR